MKESYKVKKIAKLLKKRFTDLSNEEAIFLAYQVVSIVNEPHDKMTNLSSLEPNK